MLDRFKGKKGRRLVVESLRGQSIIGNDRSLAEAVADSAEILGYASGDTIIRQEGSDNEIYFLLAGTSVVLVNGRDVARRPAGTHVGEMALVDPSKPRSASVVAEEVVVVARVSEPKFSKLATRFPRLWRNIALEMGDRLRQRNLLVSTRNETPTLFIGCSVESLDLAREIQSGLRHDSVIVRIWTDDVFRASRFPIEDLQGQVTTSDFAALLLSADDTVISRHKKAPVPRDNVIFELGLFMGALHRERTVLIRPASQCVKIPSDLLGITPLIYQDASTNDLTNQIAPVCHDLRKLILRLGSK